MSGQASPLRPFLLVEAAAFASAASIHTGLVVHGYEHARAARAESVIAVVLLIGFALSWWSGRSGRMAALAAQTFALVGTGVGLFTIAVGVGPRTLPDLAYHAAILAVLVWGLLQARRAPEETERHA